MKHPPRPAGEPLLTSVHWLAIGAWSALIAACVLTSLMVATGPLELDTTTAVTVSFLTLAFTKLWFVWNLRDATSGLWNNDVVRNPWTWGAIALCIVLLMAAVHAPGLSTLLKTRSPGLAGWLCVLGMSLVPTIVGQLYLVWRGSRKRLHQEQNSATPNRSGSA